MPKSCIPGYEEALEEERKYREEIFLGVNSKICEVGIQHITPALMVRLNRANTAFFNRNPITKHEIVRFLWILSPEFSSESDKRLAFVEATTYALIDRWEDAEDEIDDFLYATFLDSPKGGVESVPYVTNTAWTIYQMAKEPWRWSEEKTLATPLRKIHQYMRCVRFDSDAILENRSDKLKGDWLDSLRTQPIPPSKPASEVNDFLAGGNN